MFRRSWKFSAGMVQKVMFYLLSNWISLKRFVKYGKQNNNPYPTFLSNTKSESSSM